MNVFMVTEEFRAQLDAVESYLADGELRTPDQISGSVGFDATRPLQVLLETGKVSITRAGGYSFWQKHP